MSGRASLNHFFRTVWNAALNVTVAVPEYATTHGSTGTASGASRIHAVTPHRSKRHAVAVGVWLVCTALPFLAAANPAGGVAVVGQVNLVSQGNQLTVQTQNGAGLGHSAINWQSFSIPAGHTTYFAQPSSSSTVINRVVTNTPSQLFGTLGSNGKLVLVNQSGIAVGAGAVVDTAGFTASTLGMTDTDALNARLRFGDGSANGAGVSVQGNILARQGDVVLIGATIETGTDAIIQAPNGAAILAAGSAVSISARGLEGILLDVQAPSDSAVNLGTLSGDAVGIFAATLKHGGQISAHTVANEGGRVVLRAAGDAFVAGVGKIDATGVHGGSVDVLGKRVALTDQAHIDASGSLAGGVVRIGGDYQGKNSAVPNADVSYVGAETTVNADALERGNGGRVIVWADDTTRALGGISARGGLDGGDGGLVETSGHKYLSVSGARVDTRAFAGTTGSWLLDPTDITITNGTAANAAFSGGIFQNGGGTASTLTDGDLSAALDTTDVTVTTASQGAGTGNITFAPGSNVTYTANVARTLTLHADNNILMQGNIHDNLALNVLSLDMSAGNGINCLSCTVNQSGSLNVIASGDINIVDGTIESLGGATNISGNNLNVTAVNALAKFHGHNMQANLRGNVNITGGSTGSDKAAAIGGDGDLSIVANGIVLKGGLSAGRTKNATVGTGNFAGILNSGGSQNITVGAGGLTLIAGGDSANASETDNAAVIVQDGPVGTSQTITVTNGGAITVTGGSSGATSVGRGYGSMAVIQASGDSQLIDFSQAGGSITLTGGTAGSGNSANIGAINGSQTIRGLNGAPSIVLTGGASGGGDGEGNGASLQAKTTQTIDASSITLTDGAGGIGNSASIGAPVQNITVKGNLALNGGGSANGATSMGGAGIGGFLNTGLGATDLTLNVTGNLTLTAGSVSGAGLLGFNGQTTNITANVGGDIVLDPGVGTGFGEGIGALPGQTAPGFISLTAGGNIALNGKAFVSSQGNVSLTAAGRAIDVIDSSVNSAAALTINGTHVNGTNLTLTSNTAAAVAQGASLAAALTGNVVLTGGSVGTNKSASMTSTTGNQTISANGMTLKGGAAGGGLGVGNGASIYSKGDQIITVDIGGLNLIAGGGGSTETDNEASVIQGGNAGANPGTTQKITVKGGGSIVMQGGSSGLTNVGLSHGSRAQIEAQGASQTIDFPAGGAITMTGGSAGSRSRALILSGTGAQTISGAPVITLTGGSGGGVVDEGNYAEIWSALGPQTIDASGINLTGGSAGIHNYAMIGTGGNQIVTVAAGGLSASGGSGAVGEIRNMATLYQSGLTGTSQILNVTGGGNITLKGGSSQGTNVGYANGSFASIRGDGDSQTINFASAGSKIDVVGGSVGSSNEAGIYALNGSQTITGATGIAITGGASGGVLGEGNSASLKSGGNQTVSVGLGGLTLTGGGGGTTNTDNYALLSQSGTAGTRQTITVNNGGTIKMTGGSTGLTAVGANHGSRALIESAGDAQLIDFTAGGAINLTGGTVGSRAWAEIYTSNGSQNITGAPVITLTGGSSGGMVGEGNYASIYGKGPQTISATAVTLAGGAAGTGNEAYISTADSQTLTVATGGIALTAGAGVVGNHALIRQIGANGTQTISIKGGAAIQIQGGSSTDTTTGTIGSNGDIQSNGTLQTIDFTAGGAIELIGGTVGGGNQAFIRSTVGDQAITGSPSISLIGGATGGIDGEGNAAAISANLGQQHITSGNMSLTAGASGLTNSAYVHGLTQNIAVNGDLTLAGGGSGNGTITGGGVGIGGNGGANATATNLTLNVTGNLTMTGGSVSGASIGSGYVGGKSTDLTIHVGGNLTMNPGTVAGAGSRIGTPETAPAGGTISITAGGNMAFNKGTAVRTLGDIFLEAQTGGVFVDATATEMTSLVSGSGNINVVTATGFKNGSVSGYANATALAAPLGRWLIWAPDPTQVTTTTTNGGAALVPGFIQYNAAWGVSTPVSATANGLMYATAPIVSATLSESVNGAATKVYDASTAVSGMDISAVGAYPGDILTVSGTLAYASKNAGQQAINASGISLVSAVNGSVPVYGYQVNPGASFAGGLITPAPITSVSGIQASKVYDGTTTGSLSVNGAVFNGRIGADALTVASAIGTFADKNVATGKQVNITGITLGGADAGNYSLLTDTATTTADITPRATSNWVGSTTGAWSNAANWDVLPDGNNVLQVAIPVGAGVVYDAGAGTTQVQTLSSAGSLTMAGGVLNVASALTTSQLLQTAGAITGTGSLTVDGNFSQSAGTISMAGPVSVTQKSGNLVVGSVAGGSISLTANSGAISQSAALVTRGLLTTQSSLGTSLTHSGNQISAFQASNSGIGNIELTSAVPLTIVGLAVGSGDITINNTGGVSTSGAVTASNGAVTMTANSPLTVGSGGINAYGNITLTATNLTSSGDMVISGDLMTNNGALYLSAANNYAQYAVLRAAQGVTVSAGGQLTFGVGAFSYGNPITYLSNGLTVLPPWEGAALTGGPSSFVVSFLDQFQAVVDQQIVPVDGAAPPDPHDPLDPRKRDRRTLVVEGQVCVP